MSLQRFNKETLPGRGSGRHGYFGITVRLPKGAIQIGWPLAERLGITEILNAGKGAGHMGIEFAYDEEAKEWYIGKTNSDAAIPFRVVPDKKAVFANHKAMAEKLQEAVRERHQGPDATIYRFDVLRQPVEIEGVRWHAISLKSCLRGV